MINSDLIVGIGSLIIAGIAWAVTRDLTHFGGIFVDSSVFFIALFGAVIFIKGIVKPERLSFFESAIERNNILIGIAMLLVYLILMPKAGFLPATYAMYAAFNWYLGDERFRTKHIVISLLLSFIVVTAFYLVFHHVLIVPLPKGTWFE